MLAQTKAQVELAFLGPLAAGENEQIVGPGQLSHQRRDFFIVPVCLIELPHPKQAGAGEALDVRMLPGDVASQLIDDALTPGGGL